MAEPSRRTDNRIQWTLKGYEFDAEFMNLIRMAAGRQGQTLAAFVADTLRERATAILKAQEDVTPLGTPPVRVEDAVAELRESVTELGRRQAEELAAMRREARRGRWRR
jgi:uncharacterized protein (DUF1778 family)